MEETNRIAKLEENNIIKLLHQKFAPELTHVNQLIVSQLDCEEQLIDEVGKHLVESGGKRIRPLLTILFSKLFSYKGKDHIKLAASTEFIHAATLLHDDVVDASMLRRFKPTANSIWGNQAAILVGDYLFSQAFRLMVATNSISALKTLSDASAIIAKGEVSQLINIQNKKMITKEEYFHTIEAKTAELFAASCKVGALIAEQPLSIADSCYNYGKNVGLIFQIQDDLLDYFSSSDILGKNIGDDFFEGKITLPIIILHQLASNKDKIDIELFFGSQDKRDEQGLKKVIYLLNKYDIKNNIAHIITHHALTAKKSLDEIQNKNAEITAHLENLINFASNRVN